MRRRGRSSSIDPEWNRPGFHPAGLEHTSGLPRATVLGHSPSRKDLVTSTFAIRRWLRAELETQRAAACNLGVPERTPVEGRPVERDLLNVDVSGSVGLGDDLEPAIAKLDVRALPERTGNLVAVGTGGR